MRVLYINVNCKHSSTGKITYDLYTQTKEAGHGAAVCYGRGPLVNEADIYKFGLDWETRFHALMTRLTGVNGCWSFCSTKRLLRFMDEYKPDVVHLHEPHAYFMNLQPFYDYIAAHKIPLVYTFHCEYAYTGKCGYAYDCENWKTGCGNCPQVGEYPASFFFDFTRQMFRWKQAQWEKLHNVVITTPSGWLADRVKCSFLKNRDIRVVYNGVDTQHVFYRRDTKALREEHGLTDEKIVIAVAPKLMGERKGGRWVVKLAERMKHENIKFIMVGIEDMTQKFPDNVIPIARTADQHKLAEYYSLADCFVICSDKETFSMTCAESLCCGTPVAGFCSGAPETVFLEPHAVFGPYGDLETLEKNVNLQLSAGFDREKLAEDMQQLYSRDSMFGNFMSIYQELVERV